MHFKDFSVKNLPSGLATRLSSVMMRDLNFGCLVSPYILQRVKYVSRIASTSSHVYTKFLSVSIITVLCLGVR